MKIFKYPVDPTKPFSVQMPQWAKPLCVQVDQKTGLPVMWAMVEDMNKLTWRQFRVYPTGGEMYQPKDADVKYIGTFQLDGGEYVGHLFEIIP